MWGKMPDSGGAIQRKRAAATLLSKVALARRRLDAGADTAGKSHAAVSVRRAVATAQAARATKGSPKFLLSSDLWFESFRSIHYR